MRRRVCFFAVTVSFISACSFNTATATTTNPLSEGINMSAVVLERYLSPPGGAGGGGGSPAGPISQKDSTTFTGIAYPGSVVSLLKNGTIIRETTTREDGSFGIVVDDLLPGTYSFGLRAQDPNKLKSKLLLFTVYVAKGVATVIEGVYIPPTITSDKIEVKKGSSITLSGFSSPGVEVRLLITGVTNNFAEIFKKTNSNSAGAFAYALDTTSLPQGDYKVKAKSIGSKDSSPYGEELFFTVGLNNRPRTKTNGLLGFRKKCDLYY